MIKVGSDDISKIMLGDVPVSRVYRGTDVVLEASSVPWSGMVSDYFVKNGYFTNTGAYANSQNFRACLLQIPTGAKGVTVYRTDTEGGVSNANTYSVICTSPSTDDMTYSDGVVMLGYNAANSYISYTKQMQTGPYWKYLYQTELSEHTHIFIVTNAASYSLAKFEFYK